MRNNIFRQGDVLFKEIKSLPKGLKKKTDKIVAYGEVTGHTHRLISDDATIWLLNDEVKYLSTKTTSPIIHEEHYQIDIFPGNYEIIHEREYDYFDEEMKKVVD